MSMASAFKLCSLSLCVCVVVCVCTHTMLPDTNNAPSSQRFPFFFLNAFSALVSCLAPALNATTTRSLTLANAWLAAAVQNQACQVPPR